MFTVDLLHEIEIGVWRSLFIHLLRILHCGDGLVHELDKRYGCMGFHFIIFCHAKLVLLGIEQFQHLEGTQYVNLQIIHRN